MSLTKAQATIEYPDTGACPAPPPESMLRYYAALAKELAQDPWRMHAVPQRQREFEVLQNCVAEFAQDRDVLEIACGVGYWTELLASRANRVYAFDISELAIAFARQRVLAPHVELAVGDALALTLSDGRFNGAFAGFWLSHIRRGQLRCFFMQLAFLLPDGARAMFIDNEYSTRATRPYASVDADGDTYERRRLQDGSTFLVLKNYFNDDELLAAVAGAATDISIERSTYYWSLSYAAKSISGIAASDTSMPREDVALAG